MDSILVINKTQFITAMERWNDWASVESCVYQELRSLWPRE